MRHARPTFVREFATVPDLLARLTPDVPRIREFVRARRFMRRRDDDFPRVRVHLTLDLRDKSVPRGCVSRERKSRRICRYKGKDIGKKIWCWYWKYTLTPHRRTKETLIMTFKEAKIDFLRCCYIRIE